VPSQGVDGDDPLSHHQIAALVEYAGAASRRVSRPGGGTRRAEIDFKIARVRGRRGGATSRRAKRFEAMASRTEAVSVVYLIPFMLKSFLDGDRAFVRAQRR
jgi:hypothetical protein